VFDIFWDNISTKYFIWINTYIRDIFIKTLDIFVFYQALDIFVSTKPYYIRTVEVKPKSKHFETKPFWRAQVITHSPLFSEQRWTSFLNPMILPLQILNPTSFSVPVKLFSIHFFHCPKISICVCVVCMYWFLVIFLCFVS